MLKLTNFSNLVLRVNHLIGGIHPYAVNTLTELNVNKVLNGEGKHIIVNGKVAKAVLEFGHDYIFIIVNGTKHPFAKEVAYV